MSHHVFVPIVPRGHRIAYALLVGLTAAGVAAGWVFTTGRSVANSVAAAQADFGNTLEAARQVRDHALPTPAPTTAKPTGPDIDPVIQEMKHKLESQPTN